MAPGNAVKRMWLLEFLHAAERQMDLAGKPTRTGGRRDRQAFSLVTVFISSDEKTGT